MNKSVKAIVTAGTVFALGSGGFAALSLGEGDGSAALSAARSSDEAFWNRLRVSGDEVERYETLAEMAEAADLVVVGRASNFRVSRRFQGGAPEDVVVYGALDVSIERVVRGHSPGSTVEVELLLPHREDRIAGLVSQQQASLPRGEMLVFLRDKGGAEKGRYRLVEFRGLWVSENGVLHAPLAREPVPENVVALTPVQALERYEADRNARAEAASAGLLPAVIGHPGLLAAVRRGNREAAPGDDVDVSETPEDAFHAELQGRQSIGDLVRLITN